MIKKVSAVVLLSFWLAFSACSDGPTPVAETRPTSTLLPASEAYTTKTPKDGTLHVLRDFTMTGIACKTFIKVNNQSVAKLGVKETVTLYVPAGEIFVGAQSGCIASETTEEPIKIEAGKEYFFRTGFTDASTSLHLYRSSPF